MLTAIFSRIFVARNRLIGSVTSECFRCPITVCVVHAIAFSEESEACNSDGSSMAKVSLFHPFTIVSLCAAFFIKVAFTKWLSSWFLTSPQILFPFAFEFSAVSFVQDSFTVCSKTSRVADVTFFQPFTIVFFASFFIINFVTLKLNPCFVAMDIVAIPVTTFFLVTVWFVLQFLAVPFVVWHMTSHCVCVPVTIHSSFAFVTIMNVKTMCFRVDRVTSIDVVEPFASSRHFTFFV